MAMDTSGNGRAGNAAAEGAKTLKEGERILAPTRRPDGTLRKPIRIRAGYVPQDEVAIYQSKGAIWKKEMSALQEAPPGFDPPAESKPKSKSAKRNERKKEKRQQAALKSSEENDTLSAGDSNDQPENTESVSSKMDGLSLSGNGSSIAPPTTSAEGSTPEDQVQAIDKRIRALKKKIRQTEAQQEKKSTKEMKAEELEKMSKLEGWRDELKLLEGKKGQVMS